MLKAMGKLEEERASYLKRNPNTPKGSHGSKQIRQRAFEQERLYQMASRRTREPTY